MELVLIFGVWMNLYYVDNLSEHKSGCWVGFVGYGGDRLIKEHNCDELAEEINKHYITKGE